MILRTSALARADLICPQREVASVNAMKVREVLRLKSILVQADMKER
jgi:hypothetical protein